MCHHRRLGDWFKDVFKRLYQRSLPVWESGQRISDSGFPHAAPVKLKAKPRKAKVKRVNKKKK